MCKIQIYFIYLQLYNELLADLMPFEKALSPLYIFIMEPTQNRGEDERKHLALQMSFLTMTSILLAEAFGKLTILH